MKICLVSQEYPPETAWGGIGTYVYTIAQGLSDLGNEVHVIAYAPDKEINYFDQKVLVHRVRNIEIRGKYSIMSKIFYSIRVSQKIDELIDKYKIELVEGPDWCAETVWFSFRKKIPLIVKFHAPFFLMQKLRFSTIPLISCWIEKINALMADSLTSPSKALAMIVANRYNINIERIAITPFPIDEDKFAPLKVNGNNECYVLYTGRLEHNKGVHILADTIPLLSQEFPDLKFIFIGKDTNISLDKGSMKEYIIKQNNGRGNMVFTGHLGRDGLISYYQRSAICVIPSFWENFPYSCLEAMACGRPVVASDAGGLREIIDDGKTGMLVPPNNTASLARAISYLLKNKAVGEEMGRLARIKVEKIFSKNIIAKNTEIFYKNIIDESF
jgi:glycosyltransferase involved in cell wall biosynthesis